jgi:hypothetical protein
MSAVTIHSPFRSPPRMSRAGFLAVLERTGSFESDALWSPYPGNARPQVAHVIYDEITAAGHDPAAWLGVLGKESSFGTNRNSVLWRNTTRSWTNARSVRHPDIEAEIITDSYRQSQYVRYQTVRDSVADGIYRVDDPTFAYAGLTSIAEIIRVFAPSSDGNNPDGYAQQIADWINQWAAEFPPEQEPPVTDLSKRILDRIAAHGVECHDIRDRIIQHNSKRYQVLPNTNWTHLAYHFTAGGTASPQNSLAQDIARWQGHGRHHVNNNDWPGIAYTLGFSPSGRVFLLRNVNLWGFHAGNANTYALGIAGDYTTGQSVTEASLKAAATIAHVLIHETPEIPRLVQANIRGHRDFMNTTCPGNELYQWVQRAQSGTLIDTSSPVDPDPCRYFETTGHYICHGFRGFWEENGGLPLFGYPLSTEFDRNGITTQWFERARFEHQPSIADNKHGVVLGRVGAESRQQDEQDYPDEFKRQDPPD